MRMVRLLVILLVSSCLLVAFCGAQVNFSPSWGKRSITPENCKTTMDSLMYINKLIQAHNGISFMYAKRASHIYARRAASTKIKKNGSALQVKPSEAEKILDCEKFTS
uniref:Uncharacterized protein n=1 Tax=Timema douglasi TaxID=61478 RepID=A0A7R8VVQ7_TIMDO|nr:unnamed protein product [Timema douglasi]